MLRINHDSAWAKTPMWRKRIEGVLCYFVCMCLSALYPEAVDSALFETLKHQFIETEDE